jgi:hypothetical protein
MFCLPSLLELYHKTLRAALQHEPLRARAVASIGLGHELVRATLECETFPAGLATAHILDSKTHLQGWMFAIQKMTFFEPCDRPTFCSCTNNTKGAMCGFFGQTKLCKPKGS